MDKKILIVDDDFDTLHMVGKMLERHGFTILAANNGEKAIKTAQEDTPDLILLDIMMPGMDGYEVTRKLRSMENTAFIPIIMFTAKAQVDDKLEGFEAGADDYLTKPTHPAELIARVNTILTRPKTSSLETQVEAAPQPIEDAKIIGVLSPRGGMGATTLALNLAIAVHNFTNDYVTLAELRPGFGSIGLQLGYRKSDALNDLLNKPAHEVMLRDVEKGLLTHGSGIQILLASYNPNDAKLIRATDQIEAVVNYLPCIAANTILDLGVGLTEVNQKIIPRCTHLIVLVEPISQTIILSKALIQSVKELGVVEHRILPVLINRIRLEITIPNPQVQEELGIPFVGVIMPAPELAVQAASRNEPIITYQPDSLIVGQFRKLAEKIITAA
jgi:CheY-like chemotaxis protein/MinD-like ATPase involved in chromosome partitioning or flagellar assembly